MDTPILCSLNDYQKELLDKYYSLLNEANKTANLTAIEGRAEVFIKHFEDSLTGLPLLADGAAVLDIGSGAGFPAVPLKIANPSLNITLTDSVGKKTAFLAGLLAALRLDGTVIRARAEELPALNYDVLSVKNGNAVKKNARDHYTSFPQFDYAVCRAVAALPVLIEYALPYLKTGGRLLAYKAANIDAELKSAQNALSLLGGSHERTLSVLLAPDIIRNIIVIQKIRPAPAGYPRGGNKPRLKPL